MKTCMSALDVHYIIKELQFLIDSKIDKIYHPSKKELILQLYVPNQGKHQLKVNEKSIYLTALKLPPESPTEFCMYLRKKLNNARLRNIRQLSFERIISFEFEKKEGKYELIFELFSKGNIILTQDNIILTAAENQVWASRKIKPKETYIHPKREPDLFELSEESLSLLLSKTNKESIVKSLAIDLGLGGQYAEEVCMSANIDKNAKPADIKGIKKLFLELNRLLNHKLEPRIVYENQGIIDIVPFELQFYTKQKQEETGSFNKALDDYFSKEIIFKNKLESNKKLDKIKDIIKQQESQIKSLEKQETENKQKAELLYNNYELISNILKELKDISKKHNWKDIKEKLKGHKIIKEVIPSEKSIVVELK